MNTQLQRAEPEGGAKVLLQYADGLSGVLDLSPALHGEVFEPLRDPEYFSKLQVESDTVRWPNGADIDPFVLRLWLQRGMVLSQEETDAWFAAHRQPVQNVT